MIVHSDAGAGEGEDFAEGGHYRGVYLPEGREEQGEGDEGQAEAGNHIRRNELNVSFLHESILLRVGKMRASGFLPEALFR